MQKVESLPMREKDLPHPNVPFLTFIYIFLGFLGRIYFRIRFCRPQNFLIPENRPVVIVFNHTSYLDAPVIALALGLPRTLRTVFVGKKELFRGWLLGWFMRAVGGYPIDREGANTATLRTIFRILRAGKNILIAPEGTRSTTAEVGKFSSGFIALAQKTNALILPIGIKGANLALPKHAFLPRPEKVSIHLGNLIDLALYKEKDQEILAEMIRNIVIRLSEKHPCGAEIAP